MAAADSGAVDLLHSPVTLLCFQKWVTSAGRLDRCRVGAPRVSQMGWPLAETREGGPAGPRLVHLLRGVVRSLLVNGDWGMVH